MSLPQRKPDREALLFPYRDHDLLGREGEVALGKRLEAAEERMLAAALEHPSGARRLELFAESIERGDVRLHDVSRDHGGKGYEEASETLALLDRISLTLRRTKAIGRARRRGDDGAVLRAEERLLESIRAMRLERTTVHRLADEFFDQLDALDTEEVRGIADRMRRARRDYMRARDELVEANLRLVVSLARRWREVGLAFGDMVQEGTLGLMRSADHFNWQLGNRFSTYAAWWIRQSIQRGIIEQSNTIRMPYHLAEVAQKSRRVSAAMSAKLGRAPTNEEVASAIGVTVEKIESLRAAEQQLATRSLSTPIGEDGDTELGELLPANDVPDPEEAAIEQGEARLADLAIEVLDPREQHIIRMRFGLGDDRDHTLEEVGRELHVTRERVRQLERRAMAKMRKHLQTLRG